MGAREREMGSEARFLGDFGVFCGQFERGARMRKRSGSPDSLENQFDDADKRQFELSPGVERDRQVLCEELQVKSQT